MTENEERPVSSPVPALAGAFIAGAIYIVLTLLTYSRGIVISNGMIIGLHISVIVFAVGLAQGLTLRDLGSYTEFRRIWIAGWMSVLILALITALFYRLFFRWTGEAPNIPNYFARLLLSYNFFGLVISALVAFFMIRFKDRPR